MTTNHDTNSTKTGIEMLKLALRHIVLKRGLTSRQEEANLVVGMAVQIGWVMGFEKSVRKDKLMMAMACGVDPFVDPDACEGQWCDEHMHKDAPELFVGHRYHRLINRAYRQIAVDGIGLETMRELLQVELDCSDSELGSDWGHHLKKSHAQDLLDHVFTDDPAWC